MPSRLNHSNCFQIATKKRAHPEAVASEVSASSVMRAHTHRHTQICIAPQIARSTRSPNIIILIIIIIVTGVSLGWGVKWSIRSACTHVPAPRTSPITSPATLVRFNGLAAALMIAQGQRDTAIRLAIEAAQLVWLGGMQPEQYSSAEGLTLTLDVLLGRGQSAEADIAARHEVHHHHHEGENDPEHHHHDHDDFESFVVTLPEIADPAAFAQQVAQVIRAHDILRLKGFAAVAGKPLRLTLQAVGPRIDTYFDRPLDPGEPRETRLVVIGQAGLDRAAIAAALAP